MINIIPTITMMMMMMMMLLMRRIHNPNFFMR